MQQKNLNPPLFSECFSPRIRTLDQTMGRNETISSVKYVGKDEFFSRNIQDQCK